MKKSARFTFCALGGGIILIALFTLGVNLYVQSSGVQLKIVQSLCNAIQMPVSVFRTSYTPWGGFTLSRIEIYGTASENTESGAPFLTAANVKIRCRMLPLLSGKIVITRVTANHPILTWRQNDNGDWEWPATKKTGEKAAELHQAPIASTPQPKTNAAEATPSPSATSVPETTPLPKPVEAATPHPYRRAMAIRKVTLDDGILLFIDNTGREIARLEGLRLTADAEPQPENFTGKLWIARVLLRERYEIIDFNTPVNVSGDAVEAPNISGVFAGGKIKGSAKLKTGGDGIPFELKLKIKRALLATICTTDPEIASHIKGTVDGQMTLSGLSSRSRSNQGTGEFEIEGGVFQQYPLFQTVGQILRVDELETLKLTSAKLNLSIKDSRIQVEPLQVNSQNLRLIATGTVDPDQRLDLVAKLFINDKTYKRLPTEARENFVAVPESKEHSLDFNVQGDLSEPQSNLLKRLISDKLQKRVRNLFGTLFEDKKGKEDKKPESSPTP